MNAHLELAIKALERSKGDDSARAKAAFRGCSPHEMTLQYGESGHTCQEILDGYLARDAKIDAAIAYLGSLEEREQE